MHRSYDLLISSGLHIQAEVVIPIVHNLIGVPGATFERITQVSSHPVALAQCERFFASHPSIKRVATDDTAGSVREVMRAGDPTKAAIASRRAAEVYGGAILREHLEDHPENYTRFLLLATSAEVAENADKLSLVLHLAHKPGSLCSALNAFARRNLNLLKIESRPIPGTPWSYCFYLDLQASLKDPEYARGARGTQGICRFGKNSWMLSASKGLNYLSRMAFSSTGFSLWHFACKVRNNCHRLKPVLQRRAGANSTTRAKKKF